MKPRSDLITHCSRVRNWSSETGPPPGKNPAAPLSWSPPSASWWGSQCIPSHLAKLEGPMGPSTHTETPCLAPLSSKPVSGPWSSLFTWKVNANGQAVNSCLCNRREGMWQGILNESGQELIVGCRRWHPHRSTNARPTHNDVDRRSKIKALLRWCSEEKSHFAVAGRSKDSRTRENRRWVRSRCRKRVRKNIPIRYPQCMNCLA